MTCTPQTSCLSTLHQHRVLLAVALPVALQQSHAPMSHIACTSQSHHCRTLGIPSRLSGSCNTPLSVSDPNTWSIAISSLHGVSHQLLSPPSGSRTRRISNSHTPMSPFACTSQMSFPSTQAHVLPIRLPPSEEYKHRMLTVSNPLDVLQRPGIKRLGANRLRHLTLSFGEVQTSSSTLTTSDTALCLTVLQRDSDVLDANHLRHEHRRTPVRRCKIHTNFIVHQQLEHLSVVSDSDIYQSSPTLMH